MATHGEGGRRKTGVAAGQRKGIEVARSERVGEGRKGGGGAVGSDPSNLRRRVSGGYFAGCFHIHPAAAQGEAEVALRRCKTEHYYPSSPLPRTLRRPGSRVEEDATAKTKNPGNYGQGPLTPTLPPFNPRRDLSPDSWFSTFISSRSNGARGAAAPLLFTDRIPLAAVARFFQILISHSARRAASGPAILAFSPSVSLPLRAALNTILF